MTDTTRRDALARSLCARLTDDRRSIVDLQAVSDQLDTWDDPPSERPFRVYVGGSAMEMARVALVVDKLRDAGIDVVSTWLDAVANAGGKSNPRDATKAQRYEWSETDCNELLFADLLLFLVPETTAPTRGAWFEAGVAWAHSRMTVFAGDSKQSIFCALGTECESDAAAIDLVVELSHVRPLMALTDEGEIPLFPFEEP